ncbi:HAD family hydrolase [Methanohalobium sp.]|uniref:HAD family hydrolase n=1 Tax=Methanohalobium sp. TaxID=2837493 RepID=UPI0025D02B55|nr:HAD family hydrolase [Methanohalobium sp.]
MKKEKAVVFDSAGTLLQMYRVGKNPESGQIFDNIESTSVVAKYPNRALVVINTELQTIAEANSETRLIDFIHENNVDMDISCSSSHFKKNQVFDIIKKNDVIVGDIHDVICAVRRGCPPDLFYLAAGVIIDAGIDTVLCVLSTGGWLYPNTSITIRKLQDMNIDVYIASGDSTKNLKKLAQSINVPIEGVFGIANAHDKERIIHDLKNKYNTVAMVGDGMNDIFALKAADMGILTVQQGDNRSDKLRNSANTIITDIIEVVDVINQI